MRRLSILALLLPCVGLLALGQSSDAANACSLVRLDAQSMPDLVARTPVIAVGTWMSATEREAVLVVDEALKGTRVGAQLRVDNRQTHLGADCSTYEAPFKEGHRFSDGQQSVIFLEKERDGLRHVAYFSFAVYDIPDDDLAPLSTSPREDGTVTLSEIRSLLSGTTSDPALEATLGCTPPYGFQVSRVSDYRAASTAVAIVTVTSADAGVLARVDEVLSGNLPQSTLTLNDHYISTYEHSGGCGGNLETSRRGGMRPGVQYLVFLRPDEFGIAEYRPAAWGRAIVSVNDLYLTWDMFTLHDLREETAGTRAEPAEKTQPISQETVEASAGLAEEPTPTSDVEASLHEESQERFFGPLLSWPGLVAVASTALVVGFAGWGWRRFRSST